MRRGLFALLIGAGAGLVHVLAVMALVVVNGRGVSPEVVSSAFVYGMLVVGQCWAASICVLSVLRSFESYRFRRLVLAEARHG